MDNEKFMNETIDYKKMFLCLRRSIKWLIIATAAGAVLGGVLYVAVRTARAETIYASQSQFYLRYAPDPDGLIEQSYNGYTWNMLLHADPAIAHFTAAIKETPGYENYLAGMDDAAIGAWLRDGRIRGEILSDRRVLSIHYTDADSAITALVQAAAERGFLAYAATVPEIATAEMILSATPLLVVWDDHLPRAIIAGGALFMLLSFFAWWFHHILDDSLYTAADVNKRYPYPVAGILLRGESLDDSRFYYGETAENLAYLLRDGKKPIYLAVTELPYPDGGTLRAGDGVVLTVPFGRRNGKQTDRCVSFLSAQDVAIIGILITEADRRFLDSYYGGMGKNES